MDPHEEEERRWEEEAGMREPSPIRPGFEAEPDERNWSVAAQLAGFAKYLVPYVGGVLATLVIWQLRRGESEFVDRHTLEALNFQISMAIYLAIGGVLTSVLIGFLILAVLVVIDTFVMVLAALRASRGELYRYPFSLRLVS